MRGGLGVARARHFGRVKADGAPQAVGDVGKVDERAGDGAFLDLAPQVLALAAARGGDEIRHVVLGGFRRWPRLLLFSEQHLVAEPLAYEQPFRAVENIPHRALARLAHRPFEVGHPVAHFEDQQLLAAFLVEFERCREDVGRFLVVVEHVVAAHGADLVRVGDAEAPAGDVHLMHALVADVAAAVIPLPVPVVVEAVARERLRGRRPHPHVVMDALGHGFGLGAADRIAPVEAEPARHVDLTDHALAQLGHALAHRRRRTRLRSVLHDAVVLARRGDDLPALPHVVRAGLLHVHVLARLAAPDGLQRVPVVLRADGYRVDGLILEQLAVIRESRRALARELIHVADARAQDVLVHVAERGNFDIRHFAEGRDVIAPAAPQANERDPDRVVRCVHRLTCARDFVASTSPAAATMALLSSP